MRLTTTLRPSSERFCPSLVAIVVMAFAGFASAESSIKLTRTAIRVDADAPSYVRYGAEELAGYLREECGSHVTLGTTGGEKDASALIVVGSSGARKLLGEAFPAEKAGDESYILKTGTKDGTDYVIAAGASPRGTKVAIGALMKRIQVEGRTPIIAAPLDVHSTPSFATRGMHFNGWPFNSPYSFRGWTEDEWHKYLDILACQGVNLFYLWPFIEIMPVPLSKEDQAYLAECRRVIEYAQKQHGMQVWIMQCTNRVAQDRCGVTETKLRPYWRPSQKDLNPGDPAQFDAIMASREALYRALDNIDGVCNIDSDPGYYVDSPISDYVKVLNGCRALLDRCTLRGRETRLVSWMWFGWGLRHDRAFEVAHQGRTMQALQQELPEPWGLAAGRFEFLEECRRNGVFDKTVVLPYGMIEDEPSYPRTNVAIAGMRRSMERDFMKNLDLPGAIGNVQTPLLQLPHVFFFTSCIADLEYRNTSEKDVLVDLARCLYPEHAQLIADCYLAFRASDASRIASLAAELDELVRQNRLGRAGVFGRKLFPDRSIVARALVLQLRLRAAQERLMQGIAADTPKADCVSQVSECLNAYLAWDLAHGWHDFWGWEKMPLVLVSIDARFGGVMRRLARRLASSSEIETFVREVSGRLSGTYDPKIVEQGCITPLRNALIGLLNNRAALAEATASVLPTPDRHPAGAANDGQLTTKYWPGALIKDNTEWLQLTWAAPETIQRVVVRFLQHPSMRGRIIHLQHETSPGKWEDLLVTTVPDDAAAPFCVATFSLPAPVTLKGLRIVNLLDLYEVEVH